MNIAAVNIAAVNIAAVNIAWDNLLLIFGANLGLKLIFLVDCVVILLIL